MSSILTIRECICRLKEDGISISEYALRQWIADGRIPVRKIGNRSLVYYPILLEYIRHGKDS